MILQSEVARLTAQFSQGATPGTTEWEALGGDVAAVTAAARWPSIRDARAVQAAPPEVVERCDLWSLRVCASMPDTVWARASAPGTTSPRFLQQWNRTARAIDERLLASLQTLIEASLADALRRIGLKVMAAVKDAEMRELLLPLPIEEVPAISHAIELRPGRSLRAVISVEDEEQIRKAVEDLLRKARRLLERAETEALRAMAETLGLAPVDPEDREERIAAALVALQAEFERLVAQKAKPLEEAAPEEEVGEPVSGGVPFSIVRAVIAALGGAAVLGGEVAMRNGRSLPPGTGEPPAGAGLGTGPALQRIMAEELRRIGRETEALIAQSGGSREVLREARRRAAPGVVDAARLLDQDRFRMVGRSTWRRGSPSVPFPPHVALEGVSPDDQDGDWETLSQADHEYTLRTGEQAGERRSLRPFAVEGWFPGDHRGCQCWWDYETALVVVGA